MDNVALISRAQKSSDKDLKRPALAVFPLYSDEGI